MKEEFNVRGLRKYCVKDLVTNKIYEGETVLGGDYQLKNLQAVFSIFNTTGALFNISDKNITDGIRNVIRNTGLQGRWQILGRSPLTVCDTGHNKEGLEYVVKQMLRIPKLNLHIILGFVNDKDLSLVLPLFPKKAFYYFTKASISRALNEELLKHEAAKYGLAGQSYPDVKTALLNARKNATKADMIFIGGSTFVVAEVV
jgi:dihydrofolate synthase / folylpolyglutamate synthase